MQPILVRLRQEAKTLFENGGAKYLVVAIELPTGAIEIITNTSEIQSKVEYYTQTYTDDGYHRHAPIDLVGYMIG